MASCCFGGRKSYAVVSRAAKECRVTVVGQPLSFKPPRKSRSLLGALTWRHLAGFPRRRRLYILQNCHARFRVAECLFGRWRMRLARHL